MKMTRTITLGRKINGQRQEPPTLPAPRLMGWMKEFRADTLEMLLRAAAAGDLTRFRIGATYLYLVNHPDMIRRVLVDNHRSYTKETGAIRQIKAFSGENIFTGEGDFWFKRRRLIQPAFHRRHIASFGNVMTKAAGELVEEWVGRDGQMLRVDEEMMRVTLKIVGRALFSTELTKEAHVLGDAFAVGSDYVFFRVQHPLYPPLNFPTGRNKRAKSAQATVTEVVQPIIRERFESGEEKNDLLSLLMGMKDEETGEGLSKEELAREIVTMVFAGHETTSNTLTWAWYLLSQNSAQEKKLHAELDAVLKGRTPTMEDVPNLVYTRRVIDETLRLYPAAWAFGRGSLEADTLGEFAIPARTVLLISPFTMHRHPAFWDEPEMFEPDRFTAEKADKRPRYAYIPFGGGPRLCIGQPFALAEATLLLAALAQKFELRLEPNTSVIAEPRITLGVKGGLKMRLVAR